MPDTQSTAPSLPIDEHCAADNQPDLLNRIAAAIHPECCVSIVVPVRDEQELLPSLLASLANQIDFEGNLLNPQTFEAIFLFNNCTDNSAAIVENFQKQNPSLIIHLVEMMLAAEDSNIGFVRRTLMNTAYRRLLSNKFGGGVILTTDADTHAAPDWIAANLREIENGADAVGGRIIIDETELARMDAECLDFHLRDEKYNLLKAKLEALIDAAAHDLPPRHHQHFNASFAVTAAAFAKTGGIPDVKFLEDAAFYDALLRVDAKVRHSFAVKVFTSSRCVGRSDVGLSYQLNEWKKLADAGADFLVESAEAVVQRFTARKLMREMWRIDSPNSRVIATAAAQIFVSLPFLLAELNKSQTFGKFYENIIAEQHRAGNWAKNYPPEFLDKALKDLEIELSRFGFATEDTEFSEIFKIFSENSVSSVAKKS